MPSKIEWTDETWNPVRGCSKVSDGCRNCYAMRQAHRFSGPGKAYEGLTQLVKGKGPQWTGEVRCVPEFLEAPLRWKKPRRVFVNSMSDLFHPEVPFEFVDRVFAIMGQCPEHTFQILTKRPELMREYVEWWGRVIKPLGAVYWPLPNVWLGVSVEDQAMADERIPILLQTPAAVRWLSMEPLLGPVDLQLVDFDGATGLAVLDNPPWQVRWVVVGGESGPGARPMHPDWVRSIRDQCQTANVPFLFKQWGAWIPIDQPWMQDSPRPLAENETWLNQAGGSGFHGDDVYRMRRVRKKKAGRELDGRTWDQYPGAGGDHAGL